MNKLPRPISKTQELIACACGCENKLLKYDKKWRSRKFISGHQGRGRKQTEEHIRKRSEQMQGLTHPAWKGGRIIGDRGYVLIWKPDHPNASKKGYVKEHRLIMEEIIERYLAAEEIVHHINGITSDNRKENLQLFSGQGDHARHHYVR